jgi:hypothetical protein
MGELLTKYNETLQIQQQQKEYALKTAMDTITATATSRPLPAIPQESSSEPPSAPLSTAEIRGRKRTSDDLDMAEPPSNKKNTRIYDEENEIPLSNPKKRSRPAPVNANTGKSRTVSRTAKATAAAQTLQPACSMILSPRSPNSRTIPNAQTSPARTSPMKSLIARPVSPLKPGSPLKTMVGGVVAASLAGMVEHAKSAKEKARKISPRGLAEARKEKKATAAGSSTTATTTRGTRKPAAGKTEEVAQLGRVVSTSSNSSSGTTVVTKAAAAAAKKPAAKKTVGEPKAAAKKGVASAAPKSTAAKKAAPSEVPATGRRVLRKRN